MYKIALYGKGGIGKSTTVSHLAVAYTQMGYRVLQIGCDPKADSTILHTGGKRIPTVLSLLRDKGSAAIDLSDIVHKAPDGVFCVEAGGPLPGTGCAGRGIVAAFETLQAKKAFETLKPDIVLYDVLGDVVCGGFAMPIRKGYAENVFILTSGEAMSIYAAASIAMAVQHFKARGYAQLSGIILNERNVEKEKENVLALARDFETTLLETLPFSDAIQKAVAEQKTVFDVFPESTAATCYRGLAKAILKSSSKKASPAVIPIRGEEL